jgi:hypothetical protein
MDSNYEAQKQFTKQRLEARQRQADAERLLRGGRPARMSGLKQFFIRLFRRSGRPAKSKTGRMSASKGGDELVRRRFS